MPILYNLHSIYFGQTEGRAFTLPASGCFYGVLYLLNTTALSIRGIDVQYRKITIFSSLWLLWAPLTFLAIWLARRFPITTVWIQKRIKAAYTPLIFIRLLHGLLFHTCGKHTGWYYLPGAINKVYIYDLYWQFVQARWFYLLIVAIDQGKFLCNKVQDEAVANLISNQVSAAQNQLLKIQMQPHFLFNTHHSMSAWWHWINQQKLQKCWRNSVIFAQNIDMPRKRICNTEGKQNW